jgi:hypothetical protein
LKKLPSVGFRILISLANAREIKKLKKLIPFVGDISKANMSHPLSFALAKDNRD